MKHNLKWIFLFCGIFAFSQNTIKGILTNPKSEPIEDIIVEVIELEKETTSDSLGNYQLSNLPLGNYTLFFHAGGFKSQYHNIDITEEKEINFDIQLNESIIEINEVIVSTPFHQLQNENIVKVDRIGFELPELKLGLTLSESINQIPGVSLLTTGVGVGKPIIRGLSGNRVLVYAQGIRLENQQFGGEHGLGLSSAGLSSVEVIKGPASLLYGSDALGGVLYFNPEKFGNKPFGFDVSQQYFGNTKGTSTSAGIKLAKNSFRFLTRFSHQNHNNYKGGNGQDVSNSYFNTSVFKTGLKYAVNSSSSTFRYTYNKSKFGIPVTEAQAVEEPILPFQEVVNQTLSLKQRNYIGKFKLEATLGYLVNERKEFEEDFPKAALQMKLSTFSYDAKIYLPKSESFETIFGIQGLRQENKNFGLELLIPDAQVNDFGVYGVAHYHREKTDWQLGVRWDNRHIESNPFPERPTILGVDNNFRSLNASLGSKVILSNNMVLRLNAATGFRAPNLAELTSFGVHEGSNRFEIGAKNLVPENNFQADFSLEATYEHLQVSIDGFYNAFSNFIYLQPTGTQMENESVYQYSQTGANLYGGEFTFHWHPHPLDWVHLETSYEFVIGKQENKEYLPLLPPNVINNLVKFNFKGGNFFTNTNGFVGFNSVFEKTTVSKFETSTPGYTLINLGLNTSVSLKQADLEFSFAISNLFDKSYIAHLSRLKPDGLFNIGRNVSVGVDLKW